MRSIKLGVIGFVCMIALLLGACSTSGFELKESRVRALNESLKKTETTSDEALADDRKPVKAAPYRVQAGDQLAVQFFFNPELNQTTRVQPDGAITLPLMGTRSVNGMTIPELGDMVRKTYAAELRQPEVVVQLIEAVERRIYVGGQVSSPREVAYRPGLTPLEVVLAAGGFSSSAALNNVVLIRRDLNGQPTPVIVDLERMFLRNDEIVTLQPWDIVYVPKNGITKANEWVDQYVRKLFLINGISFGYNLNPNDN